MSDDPDVDKSGLPRHLAVICDGNGRWASERGLPRHAGHERGSDSVVELTEVVSLLGGIEQLTFYALSVDNRVKRPRTELAALYHLLGKYLRRERPTLMKNNIRFRTIGAIEEFPKGLQREIAESTSVSAGNTGMTMCLALNYSGRREIARAARELARKARAGEIAPDAIDMDAVAEHLYTAGMPEVDLLVRTGGDMRVSDFLLWQIAYAEIYVTDTYWPDFREAQLKEALKWFAGRTRRFGAVKES